MVSQCPPHGVITGFLHLHLLGISEKGAWETFVTQLNWPNSTVPVVTEAEAEQAVVRHWVGPKEDSELCCKEDW